MTPAAKLAEQAETIWFRLEGYALCCDVCGSADEELFADQRNNIVCVRHREEK